VKRHRSALGFATTALLLAAYQAYAFTKVHGLLGDFRAFWCAGKAVGALADPYRAVSLLGCEHAAVPAGLASAPAATVVPAPLPAYALALFVPLGALPYGIAGAAWLAVLVLCTAGGIAALARASAASTLACAWIVLPAALTLWIPLGETTPLIFAASCVAAAALARRRYVTAAVALAVCAVQPHVALPVWLAVFLWERRMRIPLLAAAAGITLICLAAGAHSMAEYLRELLPLHALAELPRDSQYSASWLAHLAGAGNGVALGIGTAAYGCAAIAGVMLARALRKKPNGDVFLVFAPLAAAVFGGNFIHAGEVVLAAPFAVSLTMRAHGAARYIAGAALLAVAFPWYQTVLEPALFLILLISAYAAIRLLPCDGRAAIAGACASTLVFFAFLAAYHAAIGIAAAPHLPNALVVGSPLASASWGRYVWTHEAHPTLALLLTKMLAWGALAVLLGFAARWLRTNSAYTASR
jgi:hypothetical protein